MNRYWLFQEYEYECSGGLEDLKGTFKTLKAAKEYTASNPWGDYSYIVDSKTWKIVCRTDNVFEVKYGNKEPKWEKVDAESYDIGDPREDKE